MKARQNDTNIKWPNLASSMKHNLVITPIHVLRWPEEYILPFHILQCANCKEYRIRTTSSKLYKEIDGELVPDTGCNGLI